MILRNFLVSNSDLLSQERISNTFRTTIKKIEKLMRINLIFGYQNATDMNEKINFA